MPKKLFPIVTILSLVFLFGCQSQYPYNLQTNSNGPPEPVFTTIETPSFDDSGKVIDIPLNSVNGISEEEALNLCFSIVGEKCEETGFRLAYHYVGAIEYEGAEYYVMNMTWLVDDNHWSYIGELIVSANGDKIYDGVIDEEGNYYLGQKRWQK